MVIFDQNRVGLAGLTVGLGLGLGLGLGMEQGRSACYSGYPMGIGELWNKWAAELLERDYSGGMCLEVERGCSRAVLGGFQF